MTLWRGQRCFSILASLWRRVVRGPRLRFKACVMNAQLQALAAKAAPLARGPKEVTMRLRVLRHLIVAASLGSVAACSSDDVVTVSVPWEIQTFLVKSGLPHIRGYEWPLVDPSENIVLFRVTHGELACPSTYAYPRAFGLKYRGRIGWAIPPTGTDSVRFDVLASNSHLMSCEFLIHVLVADPNLRHGDSAATVARWMYRITPSRVLRTRAPGAKYPSPWLSGNVSACLRCLVACRSPAS